MILSDGDDGDSIHLSEQTAPVYWADPTADDVGNVGATSAEALISGLIEAGAPRNSRPSAADQAQSITASGAH
jgi:hypothetical protein